MGLPSASPDSISNVARFLPEAARQQPDFPAVKFPAGRRARDASSSIQYGTLTFAELEARACAAAKVFTGHGLGRGDRVLLMVKPGRDLILSVFALFKMGAVPVVIDPGMGLKAFRDCVRRTRPEALVGIPLAQWVSRIFRGDFASVRRRVTVGGRRFSAQVAGDANPVFAPAKTAPDELAAILFTSGSTGPPKGVCYEHGMFEAQVRMIRAQYAIEPGEVDLPMLPIFALFNPALGMTTVVPEMNPSKPATVDPARIVRAIHQNQVTNSFGSPVLWNRIATYCEEKDLQLPSIKRILMAGAAAPPSLIARMKKLLPHGEIHTPYGATEVLPVASIAGAEVLLEAQRETESGSGVCVGRLLPEVTAKVIAIRDEPIPEMAEAEELPVGQIGEIVVSGPSVTKRYDGLDRATAQAKIAEPGKVYHRMGDLGYFDEQGRLWFCGRMAERVETEDGPLFTECVEAIFNQHPDVSRTALVGLGARPRQTPAIVVEPKPGHWPNRTGVEQDFVNELKALGVRHAFTAKIDVFYFHPKFPVDVRHNAKIHRLRLAREYA